MFFYNFSFLFPFTNNAFVVANIRPVAANVKGYITKLYVKNEQYVKKGTPLFQVFQKPYIFAYQKAKYDVIHAKQNLAALIKDKAKTQQLILAEQQRYQRYEFDYQHYHQALKNNAVSQMDVNTLLKKKNGSQYRIQALKEQLKMNAHQIKAEKAHVKALINVRNNAKVNLEETIVYAKNDGWVQNLYTAIGAPIQIRQPIFSFVNTETMYIQANFSEIDLRRLKPGQKVTIIPRMYIGSKIYHGKVISKNWAASRQVTDRRSQQQIVTNNENNWILLPQRFPVQIEIIDYDPEHYPLSIGSSAYVYIHTYGHTK